MRRERKVATKEKKKKRTCRVASRKVFKKWSEKKKGKKTVIAFDRKKERDLSQRVFEARKAATREKQKRKKKKISDKGTKRRKGGGQGRAEKKGDIRR